MRKNKKVMKAICIIIIIIAVLPIIYLFIIKRIIAKKCVDNTFNAITSGDYTNEFYYLNIDGNIQKYLDVGEMGTIILQHSEYKTIDYDFNWNDPIAKVTVEVSYPNVYEIYNKKFSNTTDLIPTKSIQDELITSLKNKEYTVVTDKIDFDIVHYKNKWYLLENEEFMNAYSGGMYNEYKKILADTFAKTEG